MRFKKQILYFTYYLKSVKRAFFHWTTLLFWLSLTLFLGIIFPNFLHRLPIFKNWDKIYTVKGSIKDERKNKLNASISIEIGGRKTKVSDNGIFVLKFPSQTNVNIPLLIVTQDTQLLKRISFKPSGLELDTSFTIYVKDTASNRN